MRDVEKEFTVSDDGKSILFDGKVAAVYEKDRGGWVSMPCPDAKACHATIKGIVSSNSGDTPSDVAAHMTRAYHMAAFKENASRDAVMKIALERENREKRVRAAYLASDLSSSASHFDVVSVRADSEIEDMESMLRRLTHAVADLKDLRSGVKDGSWRPREKDM